MILIHIRSCSLSMDENIFKEPLFDIQLINNEGDAFWGKR